MSHDEEMGMMFNDMDLMVLHLNSMPSTWQNSYLLKATGITDNFQQMPTYFVQYQSITDSQTATRQNPALAIWDQKKCHKYICTNCGQSGHFPSSITID